jgi:hypothetical protein
MSSLHRLNNLIQICFRQDGAYACGLYPTVPELPNYMHIFEVALLRRTGRKMKENSKRSTLPSIRFPSFSQSRSYLYIDA